MEINQNKVVVLTYTLVVDGAVADQATEERPLDFIFGTGTLLPKFEANLLNKKAGDLFDFELKAAEGYGEYNKEAVVELPKKVFEVDGVLREDLLIVGNTIPMMNTQGGVMPGKVTEIKEETVTMDFNHALAGKDLHFSGKILTVREATDKEVNEGLHGERVAHSCGEGCGESSCGGCCGGCH